MEGRPSQEGVAAHTELRSLLENGRLAKNWSMSQVHVRTGLGRSTVSEAFNSIQKVPSAQTVQTLARVLDLDPFQLQELRATAVGEKAPSSTSMGRPIADWDPHDLEVHPAMWTSRHPGVTEKPIDHSSVRLPGYVPRAHDVRLAALVQGVVSGQSGMAILTGSSSTGKTRACWEAIQPLSKLGWNLWHPFDPTRTEAALAGLKDIEPQTVVWLNEAQHYFGAPSGIGERISAALHSLLISQKTKPVLVLGTLWPEYADTYTALPKPHTYDQHAQLRELLAGRLIPVPEDFDEAAINDAVKVASSGDRQLAHALDNVTDGRLTQFLAGAPELLRRFRNASPGQRALLQVAMDARRLGVGLHLPVSFLAQAAEDYLSDEEFDALEDNWIEQALADSSESVHGKLSPLRRVRHRRSFRSNSRQGRTEISYRLADYLEQYGRRRRRMLCPPLSFWEAAQDHITDSNDLANLSRAAYDRYRLYWAYRLGQKSAQYSDPQTLPRLVWLFEKAGDSVGAEQLARRSAKMGNPSSLTDLARLRYQAGDIESAERLTEKAASEGYPRGLVDLAYFRCRAGDLEAAERLAQRAASEGYPDALSEIAVALHEAHDFSGAERLAQQAAQQGRPKGLVDLFSLQCAVGDFDSAERLAWEAARHGHPSPLARLVSLQYEAGNFAGAERLAEQAVSEGQPAGMAILVALRHNSGDGAGAEILAQRAAENGYHSALSRLLSLRHEAGDFDGAERLAREAESRGNNSLLDTLSILHRQREKIENKNKATEGDANKSGHSGDSTSVLGTIDRKDVEREYLRLADIGRIMEPSTFDITKGGEFKGLWPHGLNPDGTPSTPWPKANLPLDIQRESD
jgi:hypothetical protein